MIPASPTKPKYVSLSVTTSVKSNSGPPPRSIPSASVKVLPLVFKREEAPVNSIHETVRFVLKSKVVFSSNIPVSLSAKVVPADPAS